jgi:hypothetical protein
LDIVEKIIEHFFYEFKPLSGTALAVQMIFFPIAAAEAARAWS